MGTHAANDRPWCGGAVVLDCFFIAFDGRFDFILYLCTEFLKRFAS